MSQRDCGSPEPNSPIAGYRLWAPELEITNTSSKPVAVNPFHFTLEDAQKTRYVTSLVGCPPILEALRLEPGESMRGYVPFEVPKATSVAVLLYAPVETEQRKPSPVFHMEL